MVIEAQYQKLPRSRSALFHRWKKLNKMEVDKVLFYFMIFFKRDTNTT